MNDNCLIDRDFHLQSGFSRVDKRKVDDEEYVRSLIRILYRVASVKRKDARYIENNL